LRRDILAFAILTINREASVVTSKVTCLEANVEETKYMIMSRDHNAGKIITYRGVINPLKKWNSSDIWEQP